MFSVQALRTSPLDLHVLSTPPAFVLSQDQTLMFNPSQVASRPAGSPKPAKRSALLLSTLSESDCSCRKHLPSFNEKRSLFFLLCIVFKVRSPPSQAPLAVSRKGARFKRRMLLYQLSPPLSTPFFSHSKPLYLPPPPRKTPIISRFWTLFDPLRRKISLC